MAAKPALPTARRIPKEHSLAQAIGDVDEANSAIGVALLHVEDEAARAMLTAIQNELFDLGADLCDPGRRFHAQRDDPARRPAADRPPRT